MLVIAHRGASAQQTENTLESFSLAMKMGAKMAELDIHICATGEVVVFHDFNLAKLTGINKYIGDLSLKELKEVKLPRNTDIPTLEQVMDLVQGKMDLNIELKGKGTAGPCLEILKSCKNSDEWQKHCIVSSLDTGELDTFLSLTQDFKCGLILDEMNKPIMDYFSSKIYSIHYNKEIVNPGIVEYGRSRKLKIFAYTVNEVADFEKMKTLGVDGVFTDYPDRFILKN